jgi:release factor glutamine methyltransferase
VSRRTPLARTSVRDALDSAVVALTAAGCDSPRLDAELLLAAAMGVSRASVVADPSRELEPDHAWQFAEWARRRREREPVAYILGRKGFRRLELGVDRRVLVPRPETEHLVEAALGLPRGASVVDVGTGSGAVALALKDERPDLEVIGVDSSEDAIDVARANARRLGLDVTFVVGDLLGPVGATIDAVVSNPPYVGESEIGGLPADVVRFEPPMALFAGPDGLGMIERLVPAAADGGARSLALEVGCTQAGAVAEMMAGAGFTRTRVVADLAGRDRVVVGSR